jgi:cytochrome c oxidase subunit 4
MSQIRTYTVMFVALMILSTSQALLEFTGLLEQFYWAVLGVIMVLSTIKAVIVAGWYQHLRYEPRSVTYMIASGVLAVIALTAAAAYSIQ